MSIEQALAENTAALRDLVAITKDLYALRADAIEKVSGAAAPAPKKEKAEKADGKKEEAARQISESPEDRKNPYEGLKELIADYLKGTERPEEREARKEKVRNLLNHEKIKKPDVEQATATDHIKEDAVDLFKDQMAKLKAKGDITTPKSDDLDL